MASKAQALKDAGDRHYRTGAFSAAIDDYSQAIAWLSHEANTNVLYICYSNRCACFLQLGRIQEALYDAQQCTSLKSDWPKGYLRLGSCFVRLNQIHDAVAAYEQALVYDSGNKEALNALDQLRSGRSARSTDARGSPPRQSDWFDWQAIGRNVQETAGAAYGRACLWWMSLSAQSQQLIQLGGAALLVYYFFVYRPSVNSYDSYHRESSYYDSSYSGYGGGLSWTTWALVMFGAYKVPPLLPDLLGQHAQPFFGMNWTTFMWLVNMLTRNRGGFGGYGGGGMFGPRRRYY